MQNKARVIWSLQEHACTSLQDHAYMQFNPSSPQLISVSVLAPLGQDRAPDRSPQTMLGLWVPTVVLWCLMLGRGSLLGVLGMLMMHGRGMSRRQRGSRGPRIEPCGEDMGSCKRCLKAVVANPLRLIFLPLGRMRKSAALVSWGTLQLQIPRRRPLHHSHQPCLQGYRSLWGTFFSRELEKPPWYPGHFHSRLGVIRWLVGQTLVETRKKTRVQLGFLGNPLGVPHRGALVLGAWKPTSGMPSGCA
jgi:hypothetical protein